MGKLSRIFLGMMILGIGMPEITIADDSQAVVSQKPELGVGYFGIFSGPSLDFNNFTPGPDGKSAGSIGTWNVLSLNVKKVAPFSIDFSLVWDWDMSKRQKQTLLNPRVGISGAVVRLPRFSLWSNLNFDFPVTEGARAQGRLTSIGTFQETFYSIDRVRLGFFHWVRVFFYHKRGDGSGSQFEGALTPVARYVLSPSLALQMGYVMNYNNPRSESMVHAQLGIQQLQPGVNWDINSRLNLMPYLILHPLDGIKLSNSSFGFWLSATFI